jgi:hypothetical protein
VSSPGVPGVVEVDELENAAELAFLSPARWSQAPHDRLPERGYEVREYVVAGTGRLYGQGARRPPEVAGTASHVTRALVIRPVAAASFSGRVHLELLNPSTGWDFPMYWPDLASHLLRRGDAYVGVTCKSVTAASLRQALPARYGDLSIEHDGVVWDLLAGVAATLRSPDGGGLLAGLRAPERILATGWSQSGSFLRTYISEGLHELHCREAERDVFDAFLIGVSSGGFGPMGYVPLDRHGETSFDDDLRPVGDTLWQLPIDDARRVVRGSHVPVLELMSQDEALHHLWHQRGDSDVRGDLYRCYQLPGRGHESGLLDETARAADHVVSGDAGSVIDDAPPRHVASSYLLAAAVEHLWRWTRGVRAPRHDPIAVVAAPGSRLDPAGLDFSGTRCLVDDEGHALGGVRYLELDMPVAHHGHDPGSAATIKTWRTTPFDRRELSRRHGTTAELRRAASAHAWRLADAGSYLPEDVVAAVDSYCSAAGEF